VKGAGSAAPGNGGLFNRFWNEKLLYGHLPIDHSRAKFARMKEKSKGQEADKAGVADFLELMHNGQPEWAVLAVKAPIDEVSEDYADLAGSAAVHRDVPRKSAEQYDDVQQVVGVVQTAGSAWTIILRSVHYVDEAQIEGVAETAKELSARLNTRAVSFVGEDTSGANGYKLFEKGKLLEDIEWEANGEFFRFKSSLRKRPSLEKVDDSFIDGLFKEEGIYLPACYAMSEGASSWLAVEKASMDSIQRADLIELEEGDEDDEEEEEDGAD
jgi:hypothetical protein